LEAFLVSAGVVALAEFGDKTQLLALMLAARFRRPVPIVLGRLLATLANHALAAAAGKWITTAVDPAILRWILGLSFIAMAGWTMVPDKLEKKKDGLARLGVFGATLVSFFLVEMGDKTQIATVARALRLVHVGARRNHRRHAGRQRPRGVSRRAPAAARPAARGAADGRGGVRGHGGRGAAMIAFGCAI
jgi:putative Ca2+/H+ antiporter (TMEM165/GDT1 family)